MSESGVNLVVEANVKNNFKTKIAQIIRGSNLMACMLPQCVHFSITRVCTAGFQLLDIDHN